ncbi:aminotransferase class I/II-fold pyridoxal phosphate-dependent enzyme [Caldicellulosiruptor changbaiensis]|uniref:Aminotransferase n=1 Tax=Caldicellulosiruptor changbaiensis TaxID=1222016 RepID=A0A3T0D5I4_9FIRM|nr:MULTISPECIES: aminotransferase class I/II-fold pyridoxal phosphate-dependent enzyme [Caldicellulosiruptor]AZT90294.1 aminotransferase class I/II-fold pyridoxal phosphate-dependent enzyme [Caldicellulosiruptor changbaiensis]
MNLERFLSRSVQSVPPSGIRKFFDIVSEMKDALSLGVGEPDFVTPWSIRDMGIYSIEEGHTHYTSNYGLLELRKEISNYLKRRFDLNYPNYREQILVTVGASEAIDIALRSIINPGDEVLIPEPSFVSYKPCTIFAGGIPVEVPTKAENDFKLRADDIIPKITPRTKALILSYPNNPTGAIMTKEDLKELVDVLKDKDIIVISDEIYAELTYEGEHVSIANFPEMKDKTILINGFSKAFAMTGWRLGFVAANEVFIKAMAKVHQYIIMSAPTFSQYAAIEALRSGAAEVEKMREEYNRRRRYMVSRFNKMGLECFEPKGAFYVFPSIKSTGLSSEVFAEKLLYQQKVAVVPGTAFGSCGEGFIRCSYAYSIETIKEALDRIEKFVTNFKAPTHSQETQKNSVVVEQ